MFVVALFCLLQWWLLPVGVLCCCWVMSLLRTRLVPFVVFLFGCVFWVLLLCFLGGGCVAGVAGVAECVYDDGVLVPIGWLCVGVAVGLLWFSALGLYIVV